MPERKSRNQFVKAATEKADEIKHPVAPETREEAERVEPEPTGKPDVKDDLLRAQCQGGPMDGMPGETRKTRGFVVIDSHDSRAWVYDYDAESNMFFSRRKDIHDRVRHLKAVQGESYDVRAFDHTLMKGDVG
jgi:hypothetical protein